MNILRRLPLSRLLLLCGLVVAIGASATALAFALSGGPTPPAEPLAQAIHDALAGGKAQPVQGVSASITWSDRLLEGADLASGEQGGEGAGLLQSPLVAGASGRLWIGDGKLRIELQSQKGDTQVIYDGHTLTVYDASTNTEYRYTPPADAGEAEGAQQPPGAGASGEVPSVAKIEEGISRLSQHADVSGATPTDIAGQPAYTVRVSPKEGGSLFGGVELSFDADRGVPLRAAVYSATSATPVLELAASEVSYGPVEASVFELNPPSDVKVEEVKLPTREPHGSSPPAGGHAGRGAHRRQLTTYGHGPTTIAVLQAKAKGASSGEREAGALGELPKVSIDATSASELRTELGTLLSFERGGIRYLIAGAVSPAEVEAVARGL